MISILWYSICNFIAGLSPTFALLFLFRALLGIGMGAEWPAGAALAMESWPTRSRGLHERRAAGLVEHRILAVQPRLRNALRQDRLAWPADARHSAGACRHLDPHLRQGTEGVGGEPPNSARTEDRISCSAARHLPPAPSWQYADGVPVDGEQLHHLLRGLRHVRHAPAEGSPSERRDGRHADRARQPGGVPGERPLGPRGGRVGRGDGR